MKITLLVIVFTLVHSVVSDKFEGGDNQPRDASPGPQAAGRGAREHGGPGTASPRLAELAPLVEDRLLLEEGLLP
jgi:hypothetical protein